MRDAFRVCRSGLLALLTLPLFASCSALPKYETPKLSVVALKMQGGDFFSQRVQVRMRVFNPNPRELPVTGISYRIEVNDAELGEGATSAPFTVPSMGEVEFDMLVTANLAGAPRETAEPAEFLGRVVVPAGRQRETSQRLFAAHSFR